MLRDYQYDILTRIFSSLMGGHRRPLAVAPCGSGKSYIFAELARRTKGEVLVLVHRKELGQQHRELFDTLGIQARVTTYQTEYRRLGEHPKPRLLVVDEAHLSRSRTWQQIIEYYNTYTVGFSATPARLDGKPLGDIFDDLVSGVDTRWLIENHYLAPYEYYAPMTVDTSGLRSVGGDYVISELEQLMHERAIYGDIIKNYRKFAYGERTIAYCVSVKHAESVAGAFRAAGVRAEALSAKTPAKKRQQILESFRSGKISVLCNCTLLSEGISIDEVSCVMLVRPTESVALGIQQMMRCMRYLPGKTAKIIDCCSNHLRVGLPDEDREWSLSEPVRKRRELSSEGNFCIRTCPECYMVFATAPKCPFCGTEYPLHPREIAMKQEIELARITAEEAARVNEAKKSARIEQGRAATFEELVKLGKQRGYKNPAFWAAQVLRGRKRQ